MKRKRRWEDDATDKESMEYKDETMAEKAGEGKQHNGGNGAIRRHPRTNHGTRMG